MGGGVRLPAVVQRTYWPSLASIHVVYVCSMHLFMRQCVSWSGFVASGRMWNASFHVQQQQQPGKISGTARKAERKQKRSTTVCIKKAAHLFLLSCNDPWNCIKRIFTSYITLFCALWNNIYFPSQQNVFDQPLYKRRGVSFFMSVWLHWPMFCSMEQPKRAWAQMWDQVPKEGSYEVQKLAFCSVSLLDCWDGSPFALTHTCKTEKSL